MGINANKVSLIEVLKDRGEKLLRENLSPGEKALVKLRGDFGQALVLTNMRLYIIKWGFQAHASLGGRCTAYEYRNITALECRKHLMTHIFQVLTPATQEMKLSYWGARGKSNNAIESDSAVTYNKKSHVKFQGAINLGRTMISELHRVATMPQVKDDSLEQLEKLAELKVKGIITEEEFRAKKKQLLGL